MKPKLQMSLSMLIFGTISLFVRHIPLTSAEVALFRAVIALACILLAEGAMKKPLPLKSMGRDALLLFLSGAAMGFNWIFLFEAYRYTTVSVATLSYYFAPVIVMAACPLLFGERMTKKQLVCSIGATLGLVLVINPGGLNEGADPLKGVLFGLAAAVLYATVILMNKRITRVSGIDRTALQFGAAACALLPYLLLTTGFDFSGMDAPGWSLLLAVGLIHSALAYVLYFTSLRSLPGQEAALLSYIDPLTAVVISLVVLAEPVAPLQLFGGAMILAFTLANELGHR